MSISALEREKVKPRLSAGISTVLDRILALIALCPYIGFHITEGYNEHIKTSVS